MQMTNPNDPCAGCPEDESGALQMWTEHHPSQPTQAARAGFENPAVLLPIEREGEDGDE